MKAIKFVILGAGIIGLISFFLPYFNLKVGDETISPSAMQVMQGLEAAKQGAGELKSDLEAKAAELDPTGEASQGLGQAQEVIDLVKGIIIVMFLPALVLLIVGGVGAARKKLERVGGIIALLVGILGLATNGIAMAGLSDAEVQKEGMSPGIALYLMLVVCTIGFICGLLTVIKPDRGGRFG